MIEGRQTDTALIAIARNIEINLKQMIEDEPVPDALEPEDY
ncbi:MAG: hypothetical protein OXU45_02660 [Candidatus Melainabacteria bacterium]|nr:hypothetical protein [Candidatus Melainabacteria bacterium]